MAIANITGNILTDSGIATSSLLPYTGATANVNLGTYGLKAGSITTEGGYNFKILASGTLFENGYSVLSSVAGNVSITQAISAGNLKTFTFDFSAWATNTSRTYTLPDITGTLALLEGTQTFSGSKTFSFAPRNDGGILLKNNVTTGSSGYVSVGSNGAGLTIGVHNSGTNYFHELLMPISASYNYTFPAASGTVALTSDLSAYLPLTGGTLTGALSGTSATFSGNVGIGTSTVNAKLDVASTYVSDTATQVMFRDNTGGGLLFGGTGGAAKFLQAQDFTGAATYYNILLNPRGGNVGIGTSSPSDLLHLYKSSTVYQIIQTVSGGSGTVYRRSNSATPDWTIGHGAASANENFEVYTAGTGDFTWTMNGGERMRITAGGAVNIGLTSNNYARLALKSNTATTYGGFNIYSSSNDRFISMNHTGTIGVIETENAGSGVMTDLAFRTGGSERMRITSGGKVNINNNSNTNYQLYVDGGSSSAFAAYSTSPNNQFKLAGTAPGLTINNTITSPTIGGALGACTSANDFITGTAAGDMILINQFTGNKLYITNYSGGVYLTQGATSWTANSDIRIKNINSNITNAVEKLSTLQTINFCYKDDISKKENLGLIAQEVEMVFPELIETNNDGILGVRYTELIPVLIEAIKELKEELDKIKNK